MHVRPIRRCALGLLILLGACVARRTAATYPPGPGLLDMLPPQEHGTYRLVGWVLSDNTMKPVAGARVTVVGTTLTVETDKYGRYYIPDAPYGHDVLMVRMLGYETVRRPFDRLTPIGLTIGADAFTFCDTLNFFLHEAHVHIGSAPASPALTLAARTRR